VDIIQNCAVTGIRRGADGAVQGVETERGFIAAPRVGVVAAGHTSVLMAMAGVRMPLESFPLQALVSEPVKPVMPCVVMSNTIHAYISQSDKGELVIGAGTDVYTSYSQRGGLHIASDTLEAVCELFPSVRRLRMLRSWGGIVDVHGRSLADHRHDAGARSLRQLRLGHRRLQGDAGLGPRVRVHDRQGRAASDRSPVHPRPLPHRPPHRRGGGGGSCALRGREIVKSPSREIVGMLQMIPTWRFGDFTSSRRAVHS